MKKKVIIKGIEYRSIKEATDKLGITYSALSYRLHNNKEIFVEPIELAAKYIVEFNDEKMSLNKFAKLKKLPSSIVYRRWKEGIRDINELGKPYISTKAKKSDLYVNNVQYTNFIDMAEKNNLKPSTVRHRWIRGKRGVELIKPINVKNKKKF